MEVNALVMKANDNVGTVLAELKKGDTVRMKMGSEITSLSLQEDVPVWFKFSLHKIKAGEPVIKYGVQIGLATADIQPGMVVHVHNCEGARCRN